MNQYGSMRFISNAYLGRNKWWLFLVSIILVLVSYLLGIVISGFLSIILNNGIKPESIVEFYSDYPNIFIGQLGQSLEFICGLIGLLLAVKYIHKRKLLSLVTITEKLKLVNVIKGATVYFIIKLIVVIIYSRMNDNPIQYQLNFNDFFQLFFVSIFFVVIQISFEEIFHRGYLLQNFTFYFKYPFIALLFTSFLFAAVHVQNPEYFLFYFVTGFILGIITILSNSLEIAIGIHFANNIFSLIVTDDSSGTSIFYHEANPDNTFVWLTPIIIMFILSLILGHNKLRILFQKESEIE